MADEETPAPRLESVRSSERYGQAIWGYRTYYTGMITALGLLIVACISENAPSSILALVALFVGLGGMAYGAQKLRPDYRRFIAEVEEGDVKELRLRRAKWQQMIMRDSFLGRD